MGSTNLWTPKNEQYARKKFSTTALKSFSSTLCVGLKDPQAMPVILERLVMPRRGIASPSFDCLAAETTINQQLMYLPEEVILVKVFKFGLDQAIYSPISIVSSHQKTSGTLALG